MSKARIKEYEEKALKYIERVITGERIAGELEIAAVKRHLTDLDNAVEMGFYFDKKEARKVFAFFTFLKLSEGEWAGREFVLEDWQCFIIWVIFGWRKAGGYRRFRRAGVEVARKNGKTTFAAGISLYMLLMDGEAGAQVFSAAVDREQASIVWSHAKSMISQSEAISSIAKCWSKSIVYEQMSSSFKPLSRETKNKDGLNPSAAICDEEHAWPSDDILNLIVTGMGARKQPLIFGITTAGSNMSGPYYQRRSLYVDILRRTKKQEDTFTIIFTMDDGDDWKDPKNWYKASPNLGVSVYPEYMESQFDDALLKGGETEVQFKTKNLNMWVDAPKTWIQDEKIVACNKGATIEDLKGKVCYAGLDLASHVDINALSLYFPEQKALKCFYWIPEGKVKQKEDRVDYRKWYQSGWIKITPGDVIDIDYLVADITEILQMYDVKRLSFDPAKAYHGVIQGLQSAGFDNVLDEFPQNIRNMSEPTKKLESLILSGELDLMGDPVLRWMFRNVVVYTDPNDNIKLDKAKSIEKIDGVVSSVNAIGGFMSKEDTSTGYENHGVRMVNF